MEFVKRTSTGRVTAESFSDLPSFVACSKIEIGPLRRGQTINLITDIPPLAIFEELAVGSAIDL